MSKFKNYWLPVIIYAIFIFLVSSIPGNYIPNIFNFQSTVFHITEYAVFAFFINRALKACYPAAVPVNRFVWVLLIAVVYAISDEFHQKFVPNRSCSLYDVFCDGLGAVICRIFYQ
jgi:VanZ family protein